MAATEQPRTVLAEESSSSPGLHAVLRTRRLSGRHPTTTTSSCLRLNLLRTGSAVISLSASSILFLSIRAIPYSCKGKIRDFSQLRKKIWLLPPQAPTQANTASPPAAGRKSRPYPGRHAHLSLTAFPGRAYLPSPCCPCPHSRLKYRRDTGRRLTGIDHA